MQETPKEEPVIPTLLEDVEDEKVIVEEEPEVFEMFHDMETLEEDEEELPRSPNSPFGVAPVDPLVFKKTTDSPELRAAAAYVSISSVSVEREKAPEEPEKQDFASWTPGMPTSANKTVQLSSLPEEKVEKPLKVKNQKNANKIQNLLKIVFTVIAFIMPLTLLAAAIYFGIILTQ